MHTYAHVRIHMHTDAHTHTRTHAHTHIPVTAYTLPASRDKCETLIGMREGMPGESRVIRVARCYS